MTADDQVRQRRGDRDVWPFTRHRPLTGGDAGQEPQMISLCQSPEPDGR